MHPKNTPSDTDWFTPSANLEVDELVPLTSLEQIADMNAYEVWGDRITRGSYFPVANETGDVFAYIFPYMINSNHFPESEEIFKKVRELRSRIRTVIDKKTESDADETNENVYDNMRSYFQSFGAIFVSATRHSFPVPLISHSLPSYFTIGELARDKAIRQLDDSDIALSKIYFLGLHEEYFEFSSGQNRVLISAHSLESQPIEEVLVPRHHEPDHPEISRRLKNAWDQVEKHQLVGIDPLDINITHTEKKILHWELIPKIDFTYWCVPTSLAMVLSFWDNYVKGKGTITGYGRLVDYWFEHSSNGKNVPNIIDDFMDPDPENIGWRGKFQDAINKANNYSISHKEVICDQDNSWGWNIIKNEIDSGRPFSWGITHPNINHAVTVFGYRISGTMKKIIVYDPPNSHTPTFQNEYDFDQFNGIQPTRTILHLLRPNGGSGGNHLNIWKPNGGEKIDTALPFVISWYIWGKLITKSKLSFSPDGGRTWIVIADNVKSKVGWNSYKWHPTKATKKARIRIEGYTTSGEYIAGNGSKNNFEINLLPPVVVEQYKIGWDFKTHTGVVVLLFKDGSSHQIGSLSHKSYSSYVDTLRNEKPVWYNMNNNLLYTDHEPTGEEEKL